MIGALPILTGLLAVLSDDDRPDFDELLNRAVTFENGEIFFEATGMNEKEAATFIDALYAEWGLESSTSTSNTREVEYRRKAFGILFAALPQYTQLHFTDEKKLPMLRGRDSDGEDVYYRAWDIFDPSPGYNDDVEAEVLAREIHTTNTTIDRDDSAQEQFPDIEMWEMVYEARKYGLSLVKIPDEIDQPWHWWYLIRKPSKRSRTPGTRGKNVRRKTP
jgi:hypothetical protein